MLAICSGELEPLDDGTDVGREAVDVAVEIRRELVGVVEQAVEAALLGGLGDGEFGEVEERDAGDLRKGGGG